MPVGKYRKRVRRLFRRSQLRAEDIGQQSEHVFDEFLIKRFNHLFEVRRFVGGWMILVTLLVIGLVIQNLLLSNYYQKVKAVPGGIYKEGILGTFTNASPLYAASDADMAVSRLVFAGLLTYDDKGQLQGDLASDFSGDARAATYTVHLKPHLTWQDGQPLTSKDVVYTFQTIQNPDAQSPLQVAWQGIKVAAPDARTVVFSLPGPFASFPHSLTTGIVPEHILKDIPASEMRSAEFNTVKPVGAGPFSWKAIEVAGESAQAEQQIALLPFGNYSRGKPKLDEFVVHTYADKDALVHEFKSGQLTGVSGLMDMPEEVKHKDSIQTHNLLLRSAVMTFFKVNAGPLADASVRKALVQAADVQAITSELPYATKLVKEPLLIGQLAYDPAYAQPAHDEKAAAASLDAAGWKPGRNGIRTKDGKPLTFSLTINDAGEYRKAAETLRSQWQRIGVDVQLQPLSNVDFQTALSSHAYDAVMYSIAIGPDPDVFVYWDSSQADIRSANRLNLSEYKSTAADSALESGRTRVAPDIRTVKYKPFLKAWQQDAPALAMYQPRALYLTNGKVDGLDDTTINTPTDRYLNIQNWQIRQAKVTNQ